jgi:hypothetical protein
MIYLFFVGSFILGFIFHWLIHKDPEVIAEYKEKEIFEEYSRATADLLKSVQGHDPSLDLIIMLDSVAILAAYKRTPAMNPTTMPGRNYLENMT